jgi:hypothetical protein
VGRTAVVALVVLVLGGLLFLLRPDTPEGAPQARAFDVSIEGGEMSPGRIPVDQDDAVTLRVSTDKATELHVHGYGLERKVEPGKEAKIGFEADLTGRFEIEDHETEKELGVLQVRPR